MSVKREDGGAGPSAVWLAVGFLLAGLGTVLLGPILPALSQSWRLTDQQGGILLAAKFVGSFLGGVSVPRRLRFGVLGGMVFACVGFGAFALSGGLAAGAGSLFVGGFGLGQIIASTNILAGRRYREHTGSALASLNFFWSLGAVACGVIVAAVLPRFALRGPLLLFAGMFLLTGVGGLFGRAQGGVAEVEAGGGVLPRGLLVRFAVLLFLYGGLETCMTGWLTTYTLRFSDVRLMGGQSAIVLLWAALTAGRALSSGALRVMREATLQRWALGASGDDEPWAVAVALLCVAGVESGAVLSDDVCAADETGADGAGGWVYFGGIGAGGGAVSVDDGGDFYGERVVAGGDGGAVGVGGGVVGVEFGGWESGSGLVVRGWRQNAGSFAFGSRMTAKDKQPQGQQQIPAG